MGCCYSRIERQEMVSRCKARKRYMKQLVKARQSLSASQSMYLRSLRGTGSALLQFATNETTLHHHRPPLPPHQPSPSPHPPPPPPPPPLSPSTETTWTSMTASPLPPPPPPPPPPSSTWDFWDPFVPRPPSSSSDEWEEETATVSASDAAATTTVTGCVAPSSVTAPTSVVSGYSKDTNTTGSELAMVVSRNSKDLVEIVKEVDEYFLVAANAGGQLSCLLEISSANNIFCSQNKGGKVYNYGCNLQPSLWSWGSSPKLNGFGNCGGGDLTGCNNGGGVVVNNNGGGGSHCSTVERLYAWEKKLYQEVKNAETMKTKQEKKVGQLRKLEMKRGEYMKTEKTKKEVEKLESLMMVSAQAIESTSAEIIKLRETELYPQLIQLVQGLMCMWRSMYESHQVQTHIVQQLKYLNTIPSNEPTSEIHRQATLQLELEVQQWHQSFCSLVKAQRDYIQSLTGWLRLSLFQFGNNNPLTRNNHESRIYSFCEEWHLAVERIPDKVASEGIKSFLMAIHGIVVQQAEEHKQKKKSDMVLKDFEKKASELRAAENKYGPFSVPDSGNKNPVAQKKLKADTLKRKAEEEKSKHSKSVSVTRAMTLNNLQMGFPNVFQAMVGFSSVCKQAFESVYNQAKIISQEHEPKRILP